MNLVAVNPAALPLLVAGPLLASGAAVLLRGRGRTGLVVLLATLTALLGAAVALVAATSDGSVLAHQVGGWPGGIAIPLVSDAFSALVMTVAVLLTLVCSVFAIATGPGRHRLFAPLVLALTAGVNGALLTADLFNLFVFIEVMLLPSYGLLVLAARRRGTLRSVQGSRLYVTFNLFVSTVLLTGVALVYGLTGTVQLGELAGAASRDPRVAAAVGLVLVAFLMKAAVVPVHGWLARTYPSTSPAVTALFSGLHTKVAIYVVYRVYAVVFEGDSRYLWIGVVVFSATMLVGVLGAAGQSRMRSVLAFHMVSQIGYILLGVAIFTLAGLTAGIFYLLHHMVVKAALFLAAGAVEVRHGTDEIEALRGRVGREPVLALAFGVAAASLAGLPPFSGFVAKLTLVVAALDAGQVAAVVVALVVSLLTLLSMLKIFGTVFAPSLWPGTDEAPAPAPVVAPDGGPVPGDGPLGDLARQSGTATLTATTSGEPGRTRATWTAPAVALAAVTVTLGLGAQPLLALCEVAALGLLDTSAYVAAVLP
ncbi:monovalent cation/H+ antiporter subunit D family protein [Cellulomonas phragmiteti]|uniref:Cation:proton antiporter n=1 Tax=Cellulomonas phragmiteti TaxID=478780 RepID=A0ABQ4DQE1_9CELL|nr:monovalent cation/H+ antiporter subunit D family protein [Cellulomonas phragmiteti]GIG41570.1 cation:proton antiporter [Cellulomonas phragmiteti]